MKKELIAKPAILGLCPGCDTKTVDFSIPGKARMLSNARQNFFMMNDGSIMRVTICDDCEKIIDTSLAKAILQRFKVNWNTEIDAANASNERKKEIRDAHSAKEVVQVGVNPRSVIKERELMRKEEEEQLRMKHREFENRNKKKEISDSEALEMAKKLIE